MNTDTVLKPIKRFEKAKKIKMVIPSKHPGDIVIEMYKDRFCFKFLELIDNNYYIIIIIIL